MKTFNQTKFDNFHKTFDVLCYHFRNNHPKWFVRDKFMVWEYTYTSLCTGRKYTICLNYERDFAPRVWIVEPDLSKIDTYFPHVYREQSNRLCLYHPRDFQWHRNKDLIQTIILWSMLWIEFFEIFLATGNWCGPEASHDNKTTEPKITDSENTQSIELPGKKAHYKTPKPKYLKNFPIRLSQAKSQ